MNKTFFFYDLETSGLDPRNDRIMQFAGQRTDMELNKIGEPVNLLVKLGDDVLPSPYALMVTGITPQQTIDDGYRESEFCKILMEEIFVPGTTAVGYNSVRFDDEFMRYLLWRNFYDPYEWTWKDDRSRWDLLDVVRMTRALRPDGIEWPVDKDGKATNRLELLTKLNGIVHEAAHDALSDVEALIDVTKLIKEKQPQLFDYLLKMRDKKEIKKLVNLDEKREFVYSSGRYGSEFNKTTVAFPLTSGRNGNVVVYDLRYDPTEYIKMDKKGLREVIFPKWDKDATTRPPVVLKELQYNRVPAVAPVGVLEQGDGWKRIGLDRKMVEKNRGLLLSAPEFAECVREVYEERPEFAKGKDPESQLYDGFLGDKDRVKVEAVRNASEDELADFHPEFVDERLPELLMHYKARNYPKTLSDDEQVKWEKWRNGKIEQQLPKFMDAMKKLARTTSEKQQFMLQELQLWLENVAAGDY